MCTDLGLSPPTFAGRFRMVNRRRTWGTGFPDIQGQGRAIWQREHSAPPRLPIDDSLIPRLKVKERHRLRGALDTAITLYAEHAGARLRSRISHPTPVVSAYTSRTRVFYVSRTRVAVCGGVRIWCAGRTGTSQKLVVPRYEGLTEPRYSASRAPAPVSGQAKRR